MSAVMTWGQLFIYLAIFLGIYYFVIGLVFYRDKLSGLKKQKNISSRPFAVTETEKPNEQPDTTVYNNVLELMEDCKPVFQAAINQQLEKDQVLEAIRVRVQQYPAIIGTSFQHSVTHHIAQEMDNKLSMILTDEEAELIWL